MRRNPEIIRNIMLAAEKCEANQRISNQDIECEDGQEWDVSAHIKLLEQAGFIEASISKELNPQRPHTCYIYRITWQGYEYLDSIRDPEIWSKTKQSISKVGGSLTIDLIMAIAKQEIKNKLGIEI
ncbi:DUF2513 domain-containing protein [Neptuniibacter sp. QD37_11]|uniref:DUF2513 domain-containing protein n=1 Tax=Neptuniibacter sp. QD37_11 TaxID=3398209 RepID=UPI0039F54C6E